MAAQPQQLQMFPRKALIEFPKVKATADALGEVEADDMFRYYVKGDSHARPVRASEWLCTHIAEAAGVAAPNPVVIEMLDGTKVFGSRRISGVADDAVTASFLTTPSVTNVDSTVLGLKSILSKIYALDLFLHNDDRHFGNYLSVDDNGVRRLYAFDFSRALFWSWPWSGFPGGNTRSQGARLRQLHGFDLPAASSILDQLAGLPTAALESFINRMPKDWLPPDLCSQLMQVWSDGTCATRVNDIRNGLNNGSLL